MKPAQQWTAEQERGIRTVGRHLLVSAAAGSGKTAVLAERCAYLVCDAEGRCDVTHLLVVTFTRPAAAEMRERIEAALRQRLQSASEADAIARLSRQTQLLGNASIGTLHSFCIDLLREHFQLLELDPSFTILDEEQGFLLRRQIATDLFAEKYDGDEADAFRRFVDDYGGGDDQSLIAKVISTRQLLDSVVDPDRWMQQAMSRLHEAVDGPLDESELGQQLHGEIEKLLGDLSDRCVNAITQMQRWPGVKSYMNSVDKRIDYVQQWKDVLKSRGVDAMAAEVRDFHNVKISIQVRGDPEGKDQAKSLLKDICDAMNPESDLGQLSRFTEAEWQDGIGRILEPTGVFLALVREFGERFSKAKRAENTLDFSDLERLALRLLDDNGEPSAVARQYRKRFAHVLVDEYQDINEVQDRILALLSREPSDHRLQTGGNLFCVGDVKQSIYRFRLAQPDNFIQRERRFGRGSIKEGGEVIDLRTNFRSRAPLLDCLNGLFERLMIGHAMEITYDENHRLSAPATSMYDCHACADAPVDLHLLPGGGSGDGSKADGSEEAESNGESSGGSGDGGGDTRAEREAAFVAAEIKRLMAAGTTIVDRGACQPRRLGYGDIAILLRSLQGKADEFASALRAAAIPVLSASNSGFFESQEIRDLLALMAVLDNGRQDIPLAAVLRSPLMRIDHPEDEMAAARLAYPGDDVPFHSAIEQFAANPTAAKSRPLHDAMNMIARWRERMNRRPLDETLRHILNESGYLAFCAGLHDGEQRVANIEMFLRRAQQFCQSPQRQGLARFRAFLDALCAESDAGRPSLASDGADAVRIMTIHGSKGLEFPLVFIPDLAKRHTMKSAEGNILVDRLGFVGLSVIDQNLRVKYPSLPLLMAKNVIRRQVLAEELRVLYVAATRACERLILVGTWTKQQRDAWPLRWSSHIGPLPLGVMSSSQSPLAWVAPSALALAAASPRTIAIHVHEQNEPAAAALPRERRTPLQERLIARQPIEPSPATNAEADATLQRLQTPYAFDEIAALPAVRSVTQLAAEQMPMAPMAKSSAQLTITARTTEGLSLGLTAAEIGDATHRVMEHVDLNAAADDARIEKQITRMTRDRLLSPEQANSVDRDGVVWFFQSELGLLMRNHVRHVRRERTIYFPQPSDRRGLDQTMVRGRIDVLIDLPGRCVLIDYKTDRRDESQLDAQAEHHRPQLALYAAALSAILKKPVEAYLAFLTARQVRQVRWREAGVP